MLILVTSVEQITKLSEARILVFLEQADPRFRYAKFLSVKLNIEYGYCIQRLGDMKIKAWITPFKREQKVFYALTNLAPLKQAKELIAKNDSIL